MYNKALWVRVLRVNTIIFEPAPDKTYVKTCATSEDSDQPAHLHSLIRLFADGMCLLQPPLYPKREKQELAIQDRCTG